MLCQIPGSHSYTLVQQTVTVLPPSNTMQPLDLSKVSPSDLEKPPTGPRRLGNVHEREAESHQQQLLLSKTCVHLKHRWFQTSSSYLKLHFNYVQIIHVLRPPRNPFCSCPETELTRKAEQLHSQHISMAMRKKHS